MDTIISILLTFSPWLVVIIAGAIVDTVKARKEKHSSTILPNSTWHREQTFEHKSCTHQFATDHESSSLDPADQYLTPDQRALPEQERNQFALSRYVASHDKTRHQIGRDYELSVCWEYIQKGYTVDTVGSYAGLEDLGRDLIAQCNGKILIIQCKYWSHDKLIHEKHIHQLYGSVVSYIKQHNFVSGMVQGLFVTNIELSEVAKREARILGINFIEHRPMLNFPRIKCNIGRDEHGLPCKIYHLPMDDQYDSVKIKHPGEFYAFTVKEAEALGFRRAYKWYGRQDG